MVIQYVTEGGVHEPGQVSVSQLGLCHQGGLAMALLGETGLAGVRHPDLDWTHPSGPEGAAVLLNAGCD